MILIEKISGNVKSDIDLKLAYQNMNNHGKVEKISVGRVESERVRMRKVSDKGTDLALTLPQGSRLRDGDVVLHTQDRMIIVCIAPENVAIVEFFNNIQTDHLLQVGLTIGHAIGNLHRPLRIEENKVIFPIHSLSELELFKRLLSSVRDHIDIKSDNMIFEANLGPNIYEH